MSRQQLIGSEATHSKPLVLLGRGKIAMLEECGLLEAWEAVKKKKDKNIVKSLTRFNEVVGKTFNPDTVWLKGDKFYKSEDWQILRYFVLKIYRGRCQLCGATAEDNIKLHVDHIYPRSCYKELALDALNIQILCNICNMGKGARDTTDFRPSIIRRAAERKRKELGVLKEEHHKTLNR